MSVTFYPQVGDVMTQVTCGCGSTVNPTLFESYDAAYKAVYIDHSAELPICEDEFCAAYGPSFLNADDIPEVNFSNSNAAEVLDVLGIYVGDEWEDRCAGVMSGEDFLARVLLASAVQLEDAGVPAHYVSSNMISMGRREGYLNDAVARLREVAEYAVEWNLSVSWN